MDGSEVWALPKMITISEVCDPSYTGVQKLADILETEDPLIKYWLRNETAQGTYHRFPMANFYAEAKSVRETASEWVRRHC